MEKNSQVLDRIVSEHTYETFHREKSKFVLRLLLISAIVIFAVETLIMLLVEVYWRIPQPLTLFLDGLILVAILFPLNYYLIVRPMSREIDQHHRTNQELFKSHQILDRFFSINDVSIAFLDANFQYIRVNQTFANLGRQDPGDCIGKDHFTLFPNEETRAVFQGVVRTGKAYNVSNQPFEFSDNHGRDLKYWDWNLLPIKDSQGQVVQMLLVLNDVTPRRRAELAFLESERRFQAVFNQTFQHMGLLNPAGSTQLLNQTALEFSGLHAAEAIGKPFWNLPWWGTDGGAPDGLGPGSNEPLRQAIQQAACGEVFRGELPLKPGMGEPAIMDVTFKPLLDDQGQTQLIIYEARDITERIQAEQALVQSKQEIHRLYQLEMQERERAETLRGVVQALSGSLNSSGVLEILLDALSKVIPYHSAHILLLEGEDHLSVRFARGEENWAARDRLANRRLDMIAFPCLCKVLNDRQILSVANTRTNTTCRFFQNAPRVVSWLGIPLKAADQVIGLCILEHDTPGFFTEELVQWADALTAQAAIAIDHAWLFEQVRDNRAHLQALSRRLVETQENERSYIARELHDDVGQVLASLMLGLRHLELDSGSPDAVMQHCHELKQVTDGVLENLHRLAMNLRPASLDHLGLVAAVRQHAQTVSLQHGLDVPVDTIGVIKRLPGEMETAIYRIVQESLTNIIRHAHATRAGILLERRDNDLVVIVEDNGVGFDPQALSTGQLGVVGMRERADMLGGTITIESTYGKGSTVVLEVPCLFES